MPYQFDTSGRVRALRGHSANWFCWADLDADTQHRVREFALAAMRAEWPNLADNATACLSFGDIDAEALAAIQRASPEEYARLTPVIRNDRIYLKGAGE
jgi:hypothetical protein